MREVELQTFGRDKRPFLGNMVPQNLAQRFVQKMGRRMVGPHGRTAFVVDLKFQRVADGDPARSDIDDVGEDVTELLLRVEDTDRDVSTKHRARVADLPARLSVKWRLNSE